MKASKQKGPTVAITARVSKALLKVIDAAADMEGRTRTNFIMVHATRAAEARVSEAQS